MRVFARTRWQVAALALAVAPAAAQIGGSSVRTEGQDEEAFRPRLFQLYDTQAARARAEKASEAIAAGRWAEAIEELQGLIEEHEGDVLGAARPTAEGARTPSQTDVHFGAGTWAIQQLFALPPEGKEVYRQRHGARARGALDRALAAADRTALSKLAQRWPLSSAAERAWWALGDLELERGHEGDAARSWLNAARLRIGDPRARVQTAGDWTAIKDELLGTLRASGAPATEVRGAEARLDLAIARAEEILVGTSRPRDEASFVTGPATAVAAERLGGSNAGAGSSDVGLPEDAGWRAPFVLPDTPYREIDGASRLFPRRFGDTIVVNTSRSVHAIDAFSGDELWSLDAAQLGWADLDRGEVAELSEAVDVMEAMVTVAGGRGIVVAPLQIPFRFQEKDQYNNLDIIRAIPERRLVAFDVASGTPLWSTIPPASWNGDGGTFAERMSVVGAPTVVGGRVLVPLASLRGRVAFYLGCFDLETGDVLWSAPLVTGQRELNMFGRATREFSSAPPVVAGDRVIMLTQLGLIAAVDIFTGQVLWETVYDQVRVHAPRYYEEGWIENKWRNAPPVVAGDTVIAAPHDGRALLALDLETGSAIWSVDQRDIARRADFPRVGRRTYRRTKNVALIGADERTVLLGGSRVVCLKFPAGVRSGPPYALHWAWPLGNASLDATFGFPVADGDSVFVPRATDLVRLDRDTGVVLDSLRRPMGDGQPLVSRGMVFTTNGAEVHARFEWSAMVDAARAAASGPGATVKDATGLARLLLERAESILDGGGRTAKALELCGETRTLLTEFKGREAAEAARKGLDMELHRALLLETRIERLRGNYDGAEALAEAALEVSAGAAARVAARLVLLQLAVGARDDAARLEQLDALAREGAGVEVALESSRVDEDWSAADMVRLVADATRGGRVPRRDPWTDPWRSPIVPTRTRLTAAGAEGANAAGGSVLGPGQTTMDASRFALVERALLEREGAAGEGADEALLAELETLHELLLGESSELFGTTTRLWATARVESLRMLHPGAPALDVIEARAANALEAALDDARRSRSTDALESLPMRFPGTEASRRAREVRVEMALEFGTPEEVAEIVIGALPPTWTMSRATGREVSMLVQLADAVGAAGGTAFRAGLTRNLARSLPETTTPSPLPGATGDVSLASLGEAWAEPEAAPRLPRFDGEVTLARRLREQFAPVGQVEIEGPDGGTRQVALFASIGRLMAMASGSPHEPLWTVAENVSGLDTVGPDQVFVSGDTVLYHRDGRVTAVDAASGRVRWTEAMGDVRIVEATLSDGVLVVVTDPTDPRRGMQVHGIEARLGIRLWTLGPIDGRYGQSICAGDGHLALLPTRPGAAEIHDLFTGHLVSMADVGQVTGRNARAAWIADGRLVIPWIMVDPSATGGALLTAWRLADGREAWKVRADRSLGEQPALEGVIDAPRPGSPGRVRIAMVSRAPSSGASLRGSRKTDFTLAIIDEDTGRLAADARERFDAGRRLMGIRGRTRTVIDTPLIVSVSRSQTSGAPVLHALSTELETRFKVAAGRPIAPTGTGSLPVPVLGADPAGDGTVVAMVVKESGGRLGNRRLDTRLMFVDGEDGTHLGTRDIGDAETPVGGGLTFLEAFGGTLAVATSNALELMTESE